MAKSEKQKNTVRTTSIRLVLYMKFPGNIKSFSEMVSADVLSF